MAGPFTCPLCGRKEITVQAAHHTPEPCPAWAEAVARSGADEQWDRLMNWLVGLLLVAFLASLVIFQASS
jgi:hypothetical protein